MRFKLYFGIFLAAVLFLAVGPGVATASVDAPGIAWQKLLGGSRWDEARSVQQAADGGYILLGDSLSSLSGNVTGTTHGGTYSGDFWLVKTNPAGAIQWQKLLGGSKDEDGSSVQQTADGGYVAFGSTNSNANGDVSGTNRGSDFPDYWIVKLSGTGTIQWERLLGGSGQDSGRCVQQTSDGGYILLGTSSSNPSGEVTDTRNGDEDLWVVKMNATGVIQWNQLLGGSSTEEGYSVQQTSDGGYIILGSSKSSQTGDVTGVRHGTTGTDFWVVNLDGTGAIRWQRLLGGGSNDFGTSVQQTPTGGTSSPGTRARVRTAT